MSENSQGTALVALPSWFKVAAILALVWNLIGVMVFVNQMMMTPEILAKLSVAEQSLYDNVPLWATAAFAVAVFAGTLGSLALLMKKGICYHLFVASFIGVIVQMFHSFFISNSYEVYGLGGTIMPIMVLIIAFALVRFAAKGYNNHWFS